MASKPKTGIFYGWVIVVAGFIICLVAYGSMYSYGVFFGSLCEEFYWTRTAVSGAWSLFMAVHCGMSFVAGMVNDKYGPRRTMLLLAIFLGVGFALMSRINALWQLYIVYGVIIGIGMSFGQVPILSTVTRWFVERRGMAVGIASAGIGAGTIIMAPVAQFLILRFDWRTAFLIIAGIVVIVVVPISQLLLKSEPSEKGLLPYGYGKQTENKNFRNPFPPEKGDYTLKEALKKKEYWMIAVMWLFVAIAIQMVFNHIKIYATDVGIAPMTAAVSLGLVGAISIAGRITIGSVSDKIGMRRCYLIANFLMAAMMFCLLTARQPWQFYLFPALFGFGYGGGNALYPTITARYFGTKHHGAIYGMTVAICAVGTVIGPLVGGYIHDLTGSYNLALIIGGASALTGFVLAFFLRAPFAKATSN